ncbi:MAG: hypothetical protein Q9187_007709 [Circinaria calcarea]
MATSSDLDVLIDMGFDRARAELAVKKSGGLQGALEWLEQMQDKSLEEINTPTSSAKTAVENNDDANAEPPELKPGEVAKSLVCNDCGKMFRSVAQAEFHGAKTDHVNFAESRFEVPPLTEEEKKAKLEDLRRRLLEKRSGESEQDKADKKRNEVKHRVFADYRVAADLMVRKFGERVQRRFRISRKIYRRKSKSRKPRRNAGKRWKKLLRRRGSRPRLPQTRRSDA